MTSKRAGQPEQYARRRPLVSAVNVRRQGDHERVTVWVRGMSAGTVTVSSGDGDPLRKLLLSEEIVAAARTLIRHWKDQDGFNASVVDELQARIEAADLADRIVDGILDSEDEVTE
jgi:hypothetical protein